MKLTKRLLAMLLTVVMVLTMLPAIALTASAATTIVSWNAASRNANTGYSASSGTGTLTQSAATTTAGTGGSSGTYYGNWASGNTIILSGLDLSSYSNITASIQLRYRNSGTLTVSTSTNGSSYSNLSTTYSVTNSLQTFTPSGIPSDAKYVKFTITGTSGNLWIGPISLSGDAVSTKTLSSIALSGTYPTTFAQNGTFSHEGMTVTATYSDSSTADVTSSATFSGYNMATAGNQTVTVSYTEGGTTKTATYGITVNAPTPAGTLTLTEAGTTRATVSSGYNVGDTYTLPSTATNYPTDTSYNTFIGWYNGSYSHASTAPSGANFYAPGAAYTMTSSAVTLKAVYAKSSGSTTSTSVSSWATGDYYLIQKYGSSWYAMSGTGTVVTSVDVTSAVTEGTNAVTIDLTSNVWTSAMEYTVGGSSSAATIQNKSNSSYVGGNSSTSFSTTNSNKWTTTATGGGFKYEYSSRAILYRSGYDFRNYSTGNYNASGYGTGVLFMVPVGTAGSTTNYQTDFATLSSIALSGTYPTTFTQGDAFSSSGIVVTATYSDSTTADVTSSATFSGYNMSNTGSQTVTVTYVEGGVTRTATYTITVNAAVTYNITLSQTTGGTISSSSTLTGLNSGATAVISAAPATGYQLDSWTVSGTGSSYTGTNPITVTVGTAPVTVSATFSKINYTITYESAPSGGSIGIAKRSTQTLTANYGDPVDVTVTPDSDHGVGTSITVTDTTNNVAVSTTQSGNVFTFTMPAGNVTVASNANTFTVLPTYNATFIADGDTMTTLADSGHEGDSITLPTVAQMTALSKDTINYFDGSSNNTYTFVGWAPVSAINAPTGTQPTGYIAAGGSYTFGSADVQFRAIYANGSGGDGFKLSMTVSGTTYYALGNVTNKAVPTTTDSAEAAVFYLEDAGSGQSYLYYIYNDTNYYITHNSSGSTDIVRASGNSTKNPWAIGGSGNNITFTSTVQSTRKLSFDATNEVFKAYASPSSNYTFTKVPASSYLTEHLDAGNACTVTFYDTDGTTSLQSGTVYEGQTPSFTGTEPTKDPSGVHYYEFIGWNTSANQSTAVTLTAIGSSESTRSYYPVFTEHTATFTLSFSGRTTVATEGSYQSTVLTPSLTTAQTGCSATISSVSATYSSGSASIASFTTTGNVLTVTGVAEGSVTLNVTVTYDGGLTETASVTVTVVAGSGVSAGGYKLITKDNTYSDSSEADSYDWTGEYIFVGRRHGASQYINTLEILTPTWTDATTATIPDGSGSAPNATEFTLVPANADVFGSVTVLDSTDGAVKIKALHTGEADYGTDPETTGQGYVFDRIINLTDSSNNDLTNNYVLVFDRVDEVNNYYTIRIKGTNYYLSNTSTSGSGDNHIGGIANPENSSSTALLWYLSWATNVDAITASESGDTTETPDMIMVQSVTALSSGHRAVLFNQGGNGTIGWFRVYGSTSYNAQLNNANAGYNLFLYGKNIPFEAEIIYDDVERNTTTSKITVPYTYQAETGLDTILLEGLLDPESYPGWTVLNSGIPTWSLVGAYNSNGTTFTPQASVSAISNTQNAEFHVANWVEGDIGKYYVVQVDYQVRDTDGVVHDVQHSAMIVVGDADKTYNTVINEASSLDHTGSWTVPSRVGTSGVDLNAYVVDNFSTIYSARSIPENYTLTQPSTWTYTSQRDYTYSISGEGIVTWTPANILKDDVVVVTATASLTYTNPETSAVTTETVNAGTFTLYVNRLAYTAEVQDANDSSNTTIPYAATAFEVTLANFQNNDGHSPTDIYEGSTTYYSINSPTEWNWSASTVGGVSVPVTKDPSTGAATLNVTGLATGTQVIVRATNVIATSNTTYGVHTTVTVAGAIFTVGEDNSLAAVNDNFVLDFDRNAVLNVMANDRNADGATISAIGGTNASMAAIGTGANAGKIVFTVPSGQLTTATYTFTYTLSKSGETDSTATVTVKPSSAIYYEDNNTDFFTYTDGTKGKWSEVGADNAWLQDASAAADGYDAANNSLTWSAGVAHKANVGKTTDYGSSSATETWPTMEFSFVGNAFAISMMRNNYTGLIAVYVDGTKVKNLPTAYGATGGATGYDPNADHGGFIYNSSDSNYGMPAFYWAAESGNAGTHSVKVEVLYSSMYDHSVVEGTKAGNYDVYIDGVTIYNPISGTTAYKYISFRDTVLETGSLGIPTTQPHNYAATLTPASLSIGTGHTGTLQLSLTDEGETVYSGYTVAYTSSDSSVAAVTTDSLDTTTGVTTATVSGLSEGTATITATISISGTVVATRTATVTVSETVYTVTYILPNGSQSIDYSNERIYLGTNVTHLTAAQLAEYNAHPYVFRGWAPAAVNDTMTQPGGLLDDNMMITLTGNATYYAVYTYGTTDNDFLLKTDLTNPLVDGETILIYEVEGVEGTSRYVLSNQDYSSTWLYNRSGTEAVPVNGIITKTNTELYWTVEATSGGFYLIDKDGKYLSATSTDGQLIVTDTPDEKAVWNATTTGVSGNNCVYIYNNEASPKYIQHYSGYAEFCAYTYDEAYANKNEMQIYVQQTNTLTYTTNLQSNITRYTVNYYVNGTAVSSEQVVEGNSPNFPSSVSGTFTELEGYSHDYTFLGWVEAAISPDTTTEPTILETGDTYAVNATTNFYAVFRYAGAASGSGFTLSYTNSGTTYYLGTDNGSGGVAVSTSSSNAATYGLEQIGTSEYYYLYYLSGADKIYLTGAAGSSSNTRTVTFSDANTQPDSGYYKWKVGSDDKFWCYNASNTEGGALQINTSDKTYAKMYTTEQWGAYTRTETSSVNSTFYATTLDEATPVEHDYAASISPTTLALHTGETGSVTATLTDGGSTVSAVPTYTTSDASVATVASDGTVTAVGNGSATITATYTVQGNDYTATCAVTVTTLATYTVTYMVNGSQYGSTESVTEGSSPSFTAPSYDVSGYNAHAYEFLGWKEGSALNADTTEAPTLYVAGNTHGISANTTYYAVYRYTEGGSATTAFGDLSNGGSAQYVIAANVSGTWYAMPNTNWGAKINGTEISNPGSSISSSAASNYAVTIAKSSSGYTISNGTDYLTYSSSTNLGTSSSAYYWSIGSGTKGSYRVESATSGRALVYRASTNNVFGGYATNNVTANGTEYYDVEIIPVGDSSSTTYYATTLNVAAAHTYVASISPTSLTLTAGNDSSVTGTLTDNGIATNAYTPVYTSSNSSYVTVDSNGYVSAEAAGSATITVTYTVDGSDYTATCAVTVNAVGTEYAASYYAQTGVTYSGGSRSGNTITLPTSASIPGTYNAHTYTLVGWTTDNSGTATSSSAEYEPGDEVTITEDTTFYPVFSYSEGSYGGTIDFSTLGLTDAAEYSGPANGNGFAISFTNGSTNTAYYNTGTAVRVYGGGSMTVTSSVGSITGISITCASGNVITAGTSNVGTLTVSGTTGTWTGSANSVTFTRGSGSGHWRIQSVTVTISGGSGGSGGTTVTKWAKATAAPEVGTEFIIASGTSALQNGSRSSATTALPSTTFSTDENGYIVTSTDNASGLVVANHTFELEDSSNHYLKSTNTASGNIYVHFNGSSKISIATGTTNSNTTITKSGDQFTVKRTDQTMYLSSTFTNSATSSLLDIYVATEVTEGGSGSGSGSGETTYTFTLAAQTVADNYVGTASVSPSSVNIGGNTATLSASLTNNGNTVSSGDYTVSYAITSGSAATLSGTTLTSGSSAGTVTVTATFQVGGNTVATATCDLVVVDPNASVTVNYVGGSTGYVYNWGTRGEAATFLTAPTSSYYTGSYSYSTLSALSGSSTATAAAIYNSALGSAIHSMLTSKQTSTTSYDGTKTLYKYTDCVGSNTSYMSSFYSGTQITNTWDNGSTWNREHTWPNSKGLNSSDENDIMMLRPTSVSENSSRGNTAYGQSSSYYNPNSEATSGLADLRGDIARLMLQHLMRWGNTSAFYGTSGVIESRAVLLSWMEADPVDTWEMGRNDAVQRITGVRNVFVDYPELAFILLGASVPSGYTTPSSSGIVATATYNNTYNGSYTPVTRSSRIANPGVEYAVMDNEPVNETRGATRAIGDENTSLPVAGAVMLDGIGQISNNDDVMSYLAQYGAQNCLVVPANGSIVFYLTGGSAESQIAIGASALNGTGTTLKVYQISAVSGSSATGTVLLEQSLVSSTEMYFAINGIAWTGEKSNVLMVRNEGSAPMLLTNLRAVTGTVEGHISTGGTESVGNATRGITRGTDNELEMVIDSSAILAGIAGVQSINEGTFDETPVDPVDPIDPVESDIVLRGNSISLNGQIDVNFYVDVPADLLDAGVYATLDGVRADFTEGTYGTMVSKKLPAKEMNTKVTMKLYAADGTPLTFLNGGAAVTEHSYSVQDYLTYVIGNPATYGEELVKLCKAMSDYGSYTQLALDFDVENAKAIYLADEIAAVTCTGCDYSFTPNTEHISFLGASVVTESETAIRVYFALSGEGFTATVDGEPAAIQTNERGTFVEIANISAKNLGDTHTISITNGSETVTVSDYSAYSYVQSVLSYAGASDSLKLAVKALKLYGDLAAAYFNK